MLLIQDFPLVVGHKEPVKMAYVHWGQKGLNPYTATLFLPLVAELPGTGPPLPPHSLDDQGTTV